jgi:hydroxyacylglutathione hydrolase
MKRPSYFVQSLSGRDHAVGDPAASQMVNLAYLIGCRDAGECLVVDPSWDPMGLVARARQDGMRVVGSVVTHYHGDHAGGPLWGHPVAGVAELLRAGIGPVHVHRGDSALLRERCKLQPQDVIEHEEGDVITVGGLSIRVLHTPGHSPGSACFVAEQVMLTGDTLFIQGCGRVDLDTSDPQAMGASLRRLAGMDEDLEIFPGHDYGGLRAPLKQVQQHNPVFRMW